MANTDDVSPRSDGSDTDARDQLDIRLPERCNLRLHVKGDGFCSVDVSSKLEGDVDIELDHGDIRVNKIRCQSRPPNALILHEHHPAWQRSDCELPHEPWCRARQDRG